MPVTFRIRRDTAANWTAVNPVLGLGEPGLETDTRKTKYGDGVTPWSALGYSVAVVSVSWGTIGGSITAQSDLAAALAAKAPLASPPLTGTPTAPTAGSGTSSTQIATTAFVATAIAALINSSPGALDTLKELADAIGDDPNFAATMTAALGGKLAKASNLADLTDAAIARGNLLLGSMATQAASAVAITGGTVNGATVGATTAAAGSFTSLSATGTLTVGGNIQLTGSMRIGGVKVLVTRQTGWSAATGTATRTAFDTSTVTTAQLAQAVKALIDDLMTHGLIGA